MSNKKSKKKKNTRSKTTGTNFFSGFGSKKKNNDKPKRSISEKKQKNKVNKKSKTKYKKFEKCPGYESIVKGQNFEKERKYNNAIKHYNIGIEELEEYTKYNIDNALEKRTRMERINEIRHNVLKLQNQQNNKKNGSNVSKKPNHTSKPSYLPLNKEAGYKLIQDAIKQENDKKYNKAIINFEKGLSLIEESLISIQDSKEKEKRRQKIRDWRSRQQFCKNQIQNNNNKKKNKKIKINGNDNDKEKKLTEEPGYQYCEKAIQFEKENKFEIAINYYEKGIPLLEQSLITINNSSIKRERMKKIEFYRHELQKLKNLKVRRKSQYISKNNKRRNSSPRIKPRLEISGGLLYKNIRRGTLKTDIIKNSDHISMYHMLPIVASSIIHLPFPFRSCLGDGLLEALNCKIEVNGSLKQRLKMFLYSYYQQDIIQTIWGDHPSMPNIMIIDNDIKEKEIDHDPIDDELINSLFKFNDIYLENDAILFFRNIIDSEYQIGDEIIIDSYYNDIYDLMGKDTKIHKIKIKKVFKSNAKPVLITTYEKQSQHKYREISTFIIKKGDDLRLDAGAMHMFRFFNTIWSEQGLFYDGYPIQSLLYGVIPIGTDFGAIEYISNVKALRNVLEYMDKFNTSNIKNLVASAAGSYIASFVLGVRDRHYDNVLIRNDGTLFHIDFGYICGSTLFMDTAEIAITSDLKKLIGQKHWDSFVSTCVNCYMTLRLHYQEILDYSDLVFDFVEIKCDASEFLYRKLMMNENDQKAEEIIRNKVSNAPKNWSTKVKNMAHYVATL